MVPSQTSRFSYTLSSTSQVLAFVNYFLLNSHLRVVRVGEDDDGLQVITDLTESSDYSVAGAGNPSGGTVTMIPGGTHSVQVGDHIVISRNVPITQVVDYVENGTIFGANTVETSLDKLTMICQMLLDLLANASYGIPTGFVERRIRYCMIDGTQVTSTFLVKDDEA